MRWSLCWLPPSGDPKCFGTSKVSILAIASITFPSNQKELSVNYENNSPPDVARRRIAVLGYKSKSEVEGGINWIKGFLPLLWKAAETFLRPLSHPNTRNNSFRFKSEDWRPQKHPAADKIFELFPWKAFSVLDIFVNVQNVQIHLKIIKSKRLLNLKINVFPPKFQTAELLIFRIQSELLGAQTSKLCNTAFHFWAFIALPFKFVSVFLP